MATGDREFLSQGSGEEGPLVDGRELRRILGYRTAEAFRSAVRRGHVTVETFRIPGRRGRFARRAAVQAWLDALTQKKREEDEP